MAVRTFRWSGFVKKDGLSFDDLRGLVTILAFHICMAALQWKVRARIVVESGRHPLFRVVAIVAARSIVLGRKLPAVRIEVAGLAFLRRAFKYDLLCAHCGLMASATRHRPVDTNQRKSRSCVVELLHVRPGLQIVASLAAERRSVRALLSHPVLEFTFVRIHMAPGASAILELEG